jgi:hypothetical protein
MLVALGSPLFFRTAETMTVRGSPKPTTIELPIGVFVGLSPSTMPFTWTVIGRGDVHRRRTAPRDSRSGVAR